MGFGMWPLIIAVALASGPMVHASTPPRDSAAPISRRSRSRAPTARRTFQIFRKIRFPLALPMIIVGFMVGSIFGC